LDKKLSAVVKTVINRGADMHTLYRDTAGCYHYYLGSLVTLRAVLDHHPDLQKAIDKALADANRAPTMYQRARILNSALFRVYYKFNPEAEKKARGRRDKPATDKGTKDKPPKDKERRKDADDKTKDKDAKKDEDKGKKDEDKDKAKKDEDKGK